MYRYPTLLLIAAAGLAIPFLGSSTRPADAYDVQHYTVYCADDRIEVSMWDLEQMIVRRGTPVCQFASYTSYSDALRFADVNFDGEGTPCSC